MLVTVLSRMHSGCAALVPLRVGGVQRVGRGVVTPNLVDHDPFNAQVALQLADTQRLRQGCKWLTI